MGEDISRAGKGVSKMRNINKNGDEYVISIKDMTGCKHNYDNVCCNYSSPDCADFVFDEDCNECPLFEQEDGVIEEDD